MSERKVGEGSKDTGVQGGEWFVGKGNIRPAISLVRYYQSGLSHSSRESAGLDGMKGTNVTVKDNGSCSNNSSEISKRRIRLRVTCRGGDSIGKL
jgi:hypothetical protein